MQNQGFEFRRKHYVLIHHGIIEWLFAHAVACAEQPLLLLVPDSKCKHTIERLEAIYIFLFVQMNDDLGIRVSLEDVASGFLQAGFNVGEIVDLAIKYDGNAVIFVKERLVSASEINDAKAALSERYITIKKKPLVIRPAMPDCQAHSLENFGWWNFSPIKMQISANATHKLRYTILARPNGAVTLPFC